MSDRQQTLGRRSLLRAAGIGAAAGTAATILGGGNPVTGAEAAIGFAKEAFKKPRSPVFGKAIIQQPDGTWTTTDKKEIVEVELIPAEIDYHTRELDKDTLEPIKPGVMLRTAPDPSHKDGEKKVYPMTDSFHFGYRVAGEPYNYNPGVNKPNNYFNIGKFPVVHADGKIYESGLWIHLTNPDGSEKISTDEPPFVAGLSANVKPTPLTPKIPQK